MKHINISRLFPLLLGLVISVGSYAQLVRLDPPNPPLDADVTLYYDASLGNKALADYKGDLYLHTGVITNKSIDGHDWKFVIGTWGKADKKVLMKREGPNLYSFKFRINSFYPLGADDIPRQLAFVFRNEDGTIAGKTAENEDITVPVNGYVPVVASSVINRQAPRKILSLDQVNSGWNIVTDHGLIMVRPYTANILGISFSASGKEEADTSHSVVLKPGIVYRKTSKLNGGYLLESGNLSVYANSQPFFLTYIFKGDTLLKETDGFFSESGNFGVRFRLDPSEAIFGAGERAVSIDRRGFRFPLYNRPFYGYEFGATMLNYSMPLTFSSKGYAVLFDNPQKGYVDIGKTDPNVLEWGTMGGTLRYFVVTADNWPELSGNYTSLTGKQSLPPRWALGNLQSRMAYRNQAETDSIVTLMQKKKFPMDAIILDFYWFGDSIQGHLGNLDWYRKAWPNPEGMIADFKKKGIKTILITEPYVIDTVANYKDAASKGVFVTDSLGRPYLDKQFYFGRGSLIDIFKPEARDWFWNKYNKQIQIGIAAWWGDLGEPESHPADIYHITGKADEVHNIYGHYWDKMLFEKYAQNYPETRLFHLQRSGFAGSQRYSAFPWTGDVSRSWGGLQAQLPLLLTMSISGLGYIHSDAGGFAQGVKDDELYTRWLQFAVFTPILRPHGSVIPSEPVYWSEKTQEVVRKYMQLRYALIPYNYTLAWQNTTKGLPLMRPMFYMSKADTAALNANNQYFWGDNLLVAPVIQKGLTSRSVYLPAGNWFDYHTGIQYSGGQLIEYPLTIDDIPVFVKAGSFIPTYRPITTTDDYKSEEFIVRYYPENKTSFIQYEDDGKDNLALKNKSYELITYSGNSSDMSTEVKVEREGTWSGMPATRRMVFEIRKDSKPSKVMVNGKVVPLLKKVRNGQEGYTLREGWITVYTNWMGNALSVELQDAVKTK